MVNDLRIIFGYFGKVTGLIVTMGLLFSGFGSHSGHVNAQDVLEGSNYPGSGLTEGSTVEVVNPYLSIEHRKLSDGTPISKYRINGPSEPPISSDSHSTSPELSSETIVLLSNFPSYDWVFGCSAVSAAMIAAYYDRIAYPEVYTGPSNGGVMPLSDTLWSQWSDSYDIYPNNPLIASHLGIDGLETRGSIDDYWVSYDSNLKDPYLTGGWSQHPWGTAVGDYMKTSQSAYGNVDGSTGFWAPEDETKLTCRMMEEFGINSDDGTYGRKLFYEARGYTVSDCFTQNTDNIISGGFSLADFQAEINAGHPVLLNLAGHSVVGYGYYGSTIYIRDTWDNDPNHTYTMPWGGSYQGMQLLQASIVHLNPEPIISTHRAYLPLVNKSDAPNLSPTNLEISNSSLLENQPINTVVGYLSTIDPNPSDTFTYSLVSGDGSSGNASFNIIGNQLRSSQVFDYETNPNYSIRIRSTDQGGLFFEKIIVISIIDVNESGLINGDFELGHVGWVEYSSNGWEIIIFENEYTPPAYNGEWFAWLGGDYDDTSYVSQTFTVPLGLSYLHYWYWVDSEDECGYDYFQININNNVFYTKDLCYEKNTGGWLQGVTNLSSFSGQTISLKFEVKNDLSFISNIFLDDIFISNTASLQPDLFLRGISEPEENFKKKH